ncbi:hypothetical protein [Streptomyces thermolilacinus]|uniref:Uncharacterized protein n=1 Tax=Streptomyces thermolilacinus SPC6 TaxID=1306406 RepID=A0A1D3DRX2_9ACTN|nr:hypothetical protein [Streptomyces thermolilacinus]OEJ95079.1 hypothetical protein J116_011860 [Streptomyces thermolilacinus SPC6]
MSVGHTEATGGAVPGGPGRTGGAVPGGPGRTGGRGVRAAVDRFGDTPYDLPRPRRARDDRRQP